jgi:hypothetical protein
MSWQATLLEPLLVAALVSGRSAWPANRLSNAMNVLVIFSACFGFVAALFLLAGGYLWLESLYGTQTALLIVGSAAASLSVISILIVWLVEREKRHRIAAYQSNVSKTIEEAISKVLSELEQPVRDYPKSAVSLAALAGYVASDKMQDGAETIVHAFEKLRSHM